MPDTKPARPNAPAALRNRDPILDVLRRVLPPDGLVLEIASGTGQHIVHFAAGLPQLGFQPSDPDAGSRASIAAWRAHASLANVREPLDLDVLQPAWVRGVGSDAVAALLCINMIHISPWQACLGLLEGARTLLTSGAPLVLYGPYQRGGRHTAPSNADFDASLRSRDASWGVRDLGDVEGEARERGFALEEVVAMPANNLTVVFRKG
jgi:hypothetical protein